GFGYNATFRYPKRGGSGVLADALAARLAPGEVAREAAVAAVDLERRVARIPGRGEVRFARLVNTLPLPEFLDMSGPWPAEVRAARRRLRHTSVWCLNLGVDRPERTGRHWVYFPEDRYPFYRVGCYNNFSRASAPAGTTSLYVEVSRRGAGSGGVPRLERSVLAGLRACGWLGARDRILVKDWLPIPYGYVIYDFDRTPALRGIARHLERAGVDSIGRYGAWKYSFMEEALLDGKYCAERLAGRRLARVRTDTELKPI
ncbi:MAG: protoporphyrinogen oxidase, partial [Elusimicrobiota bacterium]